MIQANVDQFFAIAKEREAIYWLKREGGHNPHAPHFTADPVFQQWRFCCRSREQDKTTEWFRQEVRDFYRNCPAKVLFATVAFRWFNRIETGKLILTDLLRGPDKWNPDVIREKLKDQKPVVTGAYIIKTPNGMNKLDGVLWCIEQVRKDIDHLAGGLSHTPPDERTMEGVWDTLMTYPYLGGFMAFQIISDLMHTCWLDKAADRYMWAAPGPGSTRGLGWLLKDDPNTFKMGGKADTVAMNALIVQLVQTSYDRWAHMWTAQDVQHWLCEYDKYRRAAGGQAQKRKFR